MTVPSSLSKHKYRGNGVTREWPWQFNLPLSGGLPDTSVIEVYVVNASGVQRKLSPSEFSLNAAARKVVFPKPESGLPVLTPAEKIVLLRVVPETQLVDLENQGHFKAEVVEAGLDDLEFQIQQIDEQLSRAVVLEVGSDTSPLEVAHRIEKVAADLTNIDRVSADLSSVDAVAANSTNINVVAGGISDVGAVAANLPNVVRVASDIANVNAVAGDLGVIVSVSSQLPEIEQANGFVRQAKQWAIGEPEEPYKHSAKWWAINAEGAEGYLPGEAIDISPRVISVTNIDGGDVSDTPPVFGEDDEAGCNGYAAGDGISIVGRVISVAYVDGGVVG